MRTLNTQEIAAVSGGNFASIGSAIGGLADTIASIAGLKTDFSSSAKQVGTGINQLFTLKFSDAKTSIVDGVSGLFSNLLGLFSSSSTKA